jgi:hypothetical protein
VIDARWDILTEGTQTTSTGDLTVTGLVFSVSAIEALWAKASALPTSAPIAVPGKAAFRWNARAADKALSYTIESTEATVILKNETVHGSIAGSIALGPSLGAPQLFELKVSMGPVGCDKMGPILVGDFGKASSGTVSFSGALSGDILNLAGAKSSSGFLQHCSFALEKLPSVFGVHL